MTQIEKANALRALHQKGAPLVLFNIWDAASAKAVAEAGAKAVATGSYSLAAAQGYEDAEAIPLDFALQICARIAACVDLPLSVDFEGGYARAPETLRENAAKLAASGAVGLNFEDQIIGGNGIYDTAEQAARIAAIRAGFDGANVPAVINARTDLFLKSPDEASHKGLLDEALNRAKAYAQAGADCFFVPGLRDVALLTDFCARCPLPVNVMIRDPNADLTPYAEAGVARISFGPAPFRQASEALTKAARVSA